MQISAGRKVVVRLSRPRLGDGKASSFAARPPPVEAIPAAPVAIEVPAQVVEPVPEETPKPKTDSKSDSKFDSNSEAKLESKSMPRPPRRAAPSQRAETVIPLVHAPGDPGPEPQAEIEPELPEDARRRLRSPK
jgi:hypothetical protein